MALTPVTFQKFDGGVVDLYIGTDINKAERLNNFLIDETAKPYVRYGTSIYSTRLPFSTNRIKPTGIYLGAQPFSHPVITVGPSAYVANELSGWTEISGPNTTFLPTKTDTTYESAALWRRQIIATAPVTNLPPAMMYCTNYVQPSNTESPAAYTVRTLGVPALSVSPTIHYSSSDAYIAVYAFFYKYTFIDYTGTLFEFVGNPNIPALVNGSVNDASGPSSSNISITGIPVLSNSSLTNYDTSSQATTNTTYVANSRTATVVSATGIVKGAQIINANVVQGTVVTAISGTTITLSQPARSSASGSSTKFATMTVQIYRTINGGSVLFYNGMVPNGTTSYTDAVADATLQLQQPIYTSGGALGYDQPPLGASFVAQTNDFFWYATTTTLYQSIQGAPGACPASSSDQIDQKITGLSDIISFPILFCDKAVYRVEGTFDSFGNNGFNLREIHKTAGCVSNASIVKTPYGLVWFGNGGIYHTDGYNVKKISKDLNVSYQTWSSASVTGEYDPSRNMVYWTITSLNSSASCDAVLVLHLAYGLNDQSVYSTLSSPNNLYPSCLRFSQSQDILNSDPLVSVNATWTDGSATMTVLSATGIRAGQSIIASGIPYGTTVSSISGTTVTMSTSANGSNAGSFETVTFTQVIFSQFYGRMLMTDRLGYLLWFDPNSLTDVWINPYLYPSAMVKQTIIYDFTPAGLDQGTVGFRKYTPDVILEVDAQTPVAIQIRHRRDDAQGWSGEGGTPPTGKGIAGSPGGGSAGNPGVPEIRQDGAITWNLTDCTWGDDPNEHPWNAFGTVSGKRSVPLGQLRSNRRQLKFTNSYTIITNSDTLGTATVAPRSGLTPATLTLDTPSAEWITDPEGYYATFESDNYNQTFKIMGFEQGPAQLNYAEFLQPDSSVSLGTTAFNPDWNYSFTVAAWINNSGDGINLLSSYVAHAVPYIQLYAVDNQLGFILSNDDTFPPHLISVRRNITFANDTWNHVAFSYDGSGLASGVSIYLNGVLLSATTVFDNLGGLTTVSPNPILVGLPNFDGVNPASGFMQNFGIYYASVLTGSDIFEIYSAGRSGDLSTLSSSSLLTNWYRFNGNATDAVGGNDGVPTNVVYSSNPILPVTSVLILADPFNQLVAGSTKWEIKGFRKFERPRIVSFTLNAEVEGPTFGQATTQVGANQ